MREENFIKEESKKEISPFKWGVFQKKGSCLKNIFLM